MDPNKVVFIGVLAVFMALGAYALLGSKARQSAYGPTHTVQAKPH